MNGLSALERTVLAYFLAGPANDLNIAGRWFPRSEIELIVIDKFEIAVRKFGPAARTAAKPAAVAFVAHMIAKGGWATKENEFGGTMHQWNAEVFRAELKALLAADPLIGEAAAGGESFWPDKFAAITA